MAMTDDALLRLTALGVDDDLVVESLPLAASDGGRVPRVRPLAPTRDDRAAGRTRYEVTVDGWVIVVTAESAARAALRERATRLASVIGHAGPQTVKAKIPGRVVAGLGRGRGCGPAG